VSLGAYYEKLLTAEFAEITQRKSRVAVDWLYDLAVFSAISVLVLGVLCG